MDELKEWIRVTGTGGRINVTVTLQDGTLVVRWSVKSYTSMIRAAVVEARTGATNALADLREALTELGTAA